MLRAAICAWRIPTFAQFHIYGHGQIRLVDCAVQHADPLTEWFLNSKGIIHCSQRGQPSHAAFEGEGRIVLHKGKGWKIWVGSGEKGILLLPDLLGKGYIFKALGQAWLRENSFIDFVWRYVLGTFRG